MIKLNKIQKYGVVDLIFAIFYLSIFIFILPAHDTLASILTIGFPIILLVGGGYMIYGGKFSRELGLGLATLYLTISLFSLILLAYTVGYFKGIYGPMGKGITIVSYLAMIFVIQFFAVWPFFQIRALWAPLAKKSHTKTTKKKTSTKNSPTDKIKDNIKDVEDIKTKEDKKEENEKEDDNKEENNKENGETSK